MALLHMCKCGQKIPINNKRCNGCEEIHNRNELKRKRANYKSYNKNRDSNTRRFYGSKAWRKTRDTIKARDKGLCLVCLYNFNTNYMECVHHIEPLREAQALALEPGNLISLCEDCHKIIHTLYDSQLKKNIKAELKKILAEALGGGKSLV